MSIYPKQSTLNQSYSKHVYLVDDDLGDIALTRSAFALAFPVHFEVVSCVAALEQLFCDMCDDEYPDLILINSGLPNDESFKLIDWIRHNPVLLLTPIVMIGHRSTDSAVVRSYRLGLSCYINKSVDFTEYSIQLKDVCSYWLDSNVLPANQFSQSA